MGQRKRWAFGCGAFDGVGLGTVWGSIPFQGAQPACRATADYGAGVLYVLTVLLNVLFEGFFINGRPVLVEGVLEPGFPSSHVLAVGVIIGSTLLLLKGRVQPWLWRALALGAGLVLTLTVCGRLFSGMHWASDLLGALLLAGALVALYGHWLACR